MSEPPSHGNRFVLEKYDESDGISDAYELVIDSSSDDERDDDLPGFSDSSAEEEDIVYSDEDWSDSEDEDVPPPQPQVPPPPPRTPRRLPRIASMEQYKQFIGVFGKERVKAFYPFMSTQGEYCHDAADIRKQPTGKHETKGVRFGQRFDLDSLHR